MSSALQQENAQSPACPQGVRPWAAFVDDDGLEWLPIHDVEIKYPAIARLLDKWRRRDRCKYTADGKPPRREKFSSLDPDRPWVPEHWFWLKDHLEKIAKAMATYGQPSGKGLTEDEAIKEFGISRWRYFEVLKTIPKREQWMEPRMVEVKGKDGKTHKVATDKRVVSRAVLERALAKFTPTDYEELITPAEVADPDGEFRVPETTAYYWEKPDPQMSDDPSYKHHIYCPFLGRYITVVWKPLRRTDEAGERRKQRVNFRLGKAKHYVRQEWEKIALEMAKLDAKEGQGVWEGKDASIWKTVIRASDKERGGEKRYCHAVLWWLHKHGFIDSFKLPRFRYGNRPETTYYRQDGDRGYIANFDKAPPLDEILAERGHKRALERQKLRQSAMKSAALVSVEPPQPDQAGATPNLTKIERALMILRRDPNKSNRAIAAEVGCNPSLLSNDPTFRAAKEALRADIPHGSKDAEGNLEAQDLDD